MLMYFLLNNLKHGPSFLRFTLIFTLLNLRLYLFKVIDLFLFTTSLHNKYLIKNL